MVLKNSTKKGKQGNRKGCRTWLQSRTRRQLPELDSDDLQHPSTVYSGYRQKIAESNLSPRQKLLSRDILDGLGYYNKLLDQSVHRSNV